MAASKTWFTKTNAATAAARAPKGADSPPSTSQATFVIVQKARALMM